MPPTSALIPIQLSPRDWGTASVQIVNWLVEPGEDVLAGDLLVEVGMPGVVGDVRSPTDGRVQEICHTEGEWITTATTLGWLSPTVVATE